MVKQQIGNPLRKLVRWIYPRKTYIRFDGSTIPTSAKRLCGPEFADNSYYVHSAEYEANRLVEQCGCTVRSTIADIGCGYGRLATGLLRVVGPLDYIGIDVNKASIDWCKRYIERDNPSYSFQHLDLLNERYNSHGQAIGEGFKFDLEPSTIDIIYLYSVFSHTDEQDMRRYLTDFLRILTPDGFVFLTAFVEDDVAEVSINPDGYRIRCAGPLHVVRYRKDYLFSLFSEIGYVTQHFTYGTETDGQSAILLTSNTA